MHSARRSLASCSRRHPPPRCPFHRLGRREVFASYARAPAVEEALIARDAPTVHALQAQLKRAPVVEQQQQLYHGGGITSERLQQMQQRGPHAGVAGAAPGINDRARAIALMQDIKAARSWQHLQRIVDENAKYMNHLHVSAVVTHMAQLHAGSSGRCSDSGTSNSKVDSGSSDGSQPGAGGRSNGQSGPPTDDMQRGVAHGTSRRDGGSGNPLAAVFPQPAGALAPSATGQPIQQHKPNQLGPLRQPLGSSQCTSKQAHRLVSITKQQPVQRQLQAGSSGQPQIGPPQPLPGRPPPDRTVFLMRIERAVIVFLPQFQGRQLANTLWAIAKLGHRPPRAWLGAVLARARAELSMFEPQHLANTIYALMLLRFMPPAAWLDDFFIAVRQRLRAFGPAELAHLCYAAGKLRLHPGREVLAGVLFYSNACMKRYGIRELTLLLYGIVHMGGTVDPQWMRAFRARVLGCTIESGALSLRFLEQLAPRLNPTLADVAAAQLLKQREEQRQQQQEASKKRRIRGPRLSRNGARAGNVAGGQRNGAVDSLASGSPQAELLAAYLPTVLLCLGNLVYQPPPVFMTVVLVAIGGNAGRLNPVCLASMLLGLAYMQYKPHPQWFRNIWELVMQCRDSLDRQQCTNVLWAAGRLGCDVPPRDVHAILMRSAAQLPDHTDAEIVSLLQAAASLGHNPRPDWVELLESHLYNRLPKMQPFEVVAVLQHLADIGHKPHRVWAARWVEALLPNLAHLNLTQLATAVHAPAQLGFRPPADLLDALLGATAERMAALVGVAGDGVVEGVVSARQQAHAGMSKHNPQPQQQQTPWPSLQHYRSKQRNCMNGTSVLRRLPDTLSRLLWALAVLDVRPNGEWMASYMACLRVAFDGLGTRELSLVVWALVRLGYNPGEEWTMAFQRRMLGGFEVASAESQDADMQLVVQLVARPGSGVLGDVSESLALEQRGGGDEVSASMGVVATTHEAEVGVPVSSWDAGGAWAGWDASSKVILQGITAWATRQGADWLSELEVAPAR